MDSNTANNIQGGSADVGISIEDPNLFTYGGRWYNFAAVITNPDESIGDERLDNKHIELFEYVNEINCLFIKGRLIFTDICGTISKFLNRIDNHLAVTVRQMKKVSDGGNKEGQLEMFVDETRKENERVFTHVFIVQNIGILKREGQAVTYQLDLISDMWYQGSGKLIYSNYNIAEGINPDQIMLELFQQVFKEEIDADSFNIAKGKTPELKIKFCTNGNESLETVLPYLFNQVFYHLNQMDKDGFRFLVYNRIDNKYALVDYIDEETWLKIAKPIKMMSMFETQYEQMLFSTNQQLASVVKKPMTKMYEDMFDHNIWHFDPENASFKLENSIESVDMLKNANRKSPTFEDKTKKKYPTELNPLWFKNIDKNYSQSSLWNNDYSMYQNALENLVSRDALIINTDGDITHQPGCPFGSVIDRTITKMDDISKRHLDEINERYKQMEWMFISLKVRHIYKPSTPNPSYTENIVFGRNFTYEPT